MRDPAYQETVQYAEHRDEHWAHPDLLLVPGSGGHPEVDTAIASSEAAVLGLTIHSRWGLRDVQ